MGIDLAAPLVAMPLAEGSGGIDASHPLRLAREENTRRFERAYLDDLLRRHGDHLTAAARGAGVDRTHLYRLLWKHGLK